MTKDESVITHALLEPDAPTNVTGTISGIVSSTQKVIAVVLSTRKISPPIASQRGASSPWQASPLSLLTVTVLENKKHPDNLSRLPPT